MLDTSNKIALLFFFCFVSFCNQVSNTTQNSGKEQPQPVEDTSDFAKIESVSVEGNPKDYTFSVEVKSPDTGCQQYTDWWEVVDLDGNLIYRRILLHSHVDEQPFTRSGGPVDISSSKEVIVRAHMNNSGYNNGVMIGSVASGFEPDSVAADFATDLQNAEPQPDGCAF